MMDTHTPEKVKLLLSPRQSRGITCFIYVSYPCVRLEAAAVACARKPGHLSDTHCESPVGQIRAQVAGGMGGFGPRRDADLRQQ
jgi:hypothetical protein